MAGGNKFYSKRTHDSGIMRVQTGVRSGKVQMRFTVPGAPAVSLSLDAAEDLADALDQALAAQEDHPIT